ncbi:mobile mystery protein A [Caulobacter segnis]|uniref:mobile mystery protein A n=1 Tax=Caulobacter segnis TaxID=88688 RepID=UPI00240F36CD|nr:mobile mystery protein A [Caulobacter segnis]MDG2520418.1 mobile mystery protein A [Caulobacter segnis]
MYAADRAARALDAKLALARNSLGARPPRGWLRAIRDALGLTTKQLAKRLGVSQPRVVALEKGEVDETVTLASLRRAAEAMDCQLVYAMVPNRPLVDMIRERAEVRADEQTASVSHTVRLENQALTADDQRRQREILIDQLLRGKLSRLWDEPA